MFTVIKEICFVIAATLTFVAFMAMLEEIAYLAIDYEEEQAYKEWVIKCDRREVVCINHGELIIPEDMPKVQVNF